VTTESWISADLFGGELLGGHRSTPVVTAADVQRAVTESILRLTSSRRRFRADQRGTILITTSGSRVGQVNGLAIYDMGEPLREAVADHRRDLLRQSGYQHRARVGLQRTQP